MKLNFTTALAALEDLTNNRNKQITEQEYELFCKEFIFEKIKGLSFGQAFCERFEFNGIFLKGLSDDLAKNHIEKLGYIKK